LCARLSGAGSLANESTYANCSLFVVRCSLFVVRCSYFVLRTSFFVLRYSLFGLRRGELRRPAICKRCTVPGTRDSVAPDCIRRPARRPGGMLPREDAVSLIGRPRAAARRRIHSGATPRHGTLFVCPLARVEPRSFVSRNLSYGSLAIRPRPRVHTR
jgi:hypothetical protein